MKRPVLWALVVRGTPYLALSIPGGACVSENKAAVVDEHRRITAAWRSTFAERKNKRSPWEVVKYERVP